MCRCAGGHSPNTISCLRVARGFCLTTLLLACAFVQPLGITSHAAQLGETTFETVSSNPDLLPAENVTFYYQAGRTNLLLVLEPLAGVSGTVTVNVFASTLGGDPYAVVPVHLSRVPPPVQPQVVIGHPRITQNHVTVTFGASAGSSYAIEVSPDLVSWVEIGQVTAATSEVVYDDPDLTTLPSRFYRIRRL